VKSIGFSVYSIIWQSDNVPIVTMYIQPLARSAWFTSSWKQQSVTTIMEAQYGGNRTCWFFSHISIVLTCLHRVNTQFIHFSKIQNTSASLMARWRFGLVVKRWCWVNVVALCRARLVLGWVTVRWYTFLVFNQATQAYPAWPSRRAMRTGNGLGHR